MVLLQPTRRLKQPLRPGRSHRFAGLLALAQQRLATLAMPRASTPPPRGEPIRIKPDLRHLRLLVPADLLGQALLGSLKRGATPVLSTQMLRQLITTIGAEETVLPTVGLLGLLEDVGHQPLIGTVRAP